MAEIITGLVSEDGKIYEGTGFEVEIYENYGKTYGYIIKFPNLSRVPTIMCQAYEIDDAITCVTIGSRPSSPVEVAVATLDTSGRFIKNAFSFIAVSND